MSAYEQYIRSGVMIQSRNFFGYNTSGAWYSGSFPNLGILGHDQPIPERPHLYSLAASDLVQ